MFREKGGDESNEWNEDRNQVNKRKDRKGAVCGDGMKEEGRKGKSVEWKAVEGNRNAFPIHNNIRLAVRHPGDEPSDILERN